MLIKTILILTLGIVWIQDSKERQVYWFLFPIIGGLCGFLFYNSTLTELFLASVALNSVFIFILILIVFLYSTFKLKTAFLSTIGLGDLLFFAGISLSFSTVSFIFIFICALIFSLIMHLIVKRKAIITTVPLAGYMSLFFLLTYISFWSGFIDDLYVI
jgi:hypothetical protein